MSLETLSSNVLLHLNPIQHFTQFFDKLIFQSEFFSRFSKFPVGFSRSKEEEKLIVRTHYENSIWNSENLQRMMRQKLSIIVYRVRMDTRIPPGRMVHLTFENLPIALSSISLYSLDPSSTTSWTVVWWLFGRARTFAQFTLGRSEESAHREEKTMSRSHSPRRLFFFLFFFHWMAC